METGKKCDKKVQRFTGNERGGISNTSLCKKDVDGVRSCHNILNSTNKIIL